MNDSQHREDAGERRPAYGAMRSDYPSYDPYLFGAPDRPADDDPANGAPAAQGPQTPAPVQPGPAQAPFQTPWAQGMQGQPGNANPGGRNPTGRFGVNVDDPRQNPLYGRWDPYAIIAFVFAILFINMPVMPAIMGALSMWRTRTFRMKGFGLALAAVVINVIATLAVLWAAFNHVDLADLLLQFAGYGSGTDGSTDGGVQAMAVAFRVA